MIIQQRKTKNLSYSSAESEQLKYTNHKVLSLTCVYACKINIFLGVCDCSVSSFALASSRLTIAVLADTETCWTDVVSFAPLSLLVSSFLSILGTWSLYTNQCRIPNDNQVAEELFDQCICAGEKDAFAFRRYHHLIYTGHVVIVEATFPFNNNPAHRILNQIEKKEKLRTFVTDWKASILEQWPHDS